MLVNVRVKLNQTQYSILFIGSLTLLLLGVVLLTACQVPEESAEEAALAGEAISLGCTRSPVRSCRSTAEGISGTFVSGRAFTYRNSCTAAGQSAAKYRCVSNRLFYEVCRSTCELATDICKSGECCQRTSPNTPIVNVCNGNVLTNTTATSCGSAIYSYDCSTAVRAQRCDPRAPNGIIITPYDPATRARETRGPGPSCVPR